MKKQKRPPFTLVDLSKVDRAEEFLLAAIAEAAKRTGRVGHSPEQALREVFGMREVDLSLAGLFEGFGGCSPFDAKQEYKIGGYGPLTADEVAVSNANRVIGEKVRQHRYAGGKPCP